MTNFKGLNRSKTLSVFVVASCLLLHSACSFFKKPKAIMGRSFYLQSTANVSPELGGVDFVRFHSETEAELKHGDIVENCTVTHLNDKISLRGKLFQTTTEFTFEDDRLKDNHGNIWDSKETAQKPVNIEGKDGKKLVISFNDEVATVFFNGEKIELRQVPSASGIVYKNEHFEYEEHQGAVLLKKEGREIFSNKAAGKTP